jgi:hypothetical protein
MLAGGETLKRNRADRDPGQSHDLVPKPGQHPADLALLAFGQHQFDRGRLTLGAHEPGPLGANLAVGEPDPFDQLAHYLAAGDSRHQGPVRLLDPVPRVGQAVGQLAVVGQDHEAGAVLIEPSDRVDALGDLRQQVDHPRPAGGVTVGRDVTLRLVHGIVNQPLLEDVLAIHGDCCLGGIDARAQLADDLAINRDPPLADKLLALPARAQPRVRQDLLESLRLATGGALLMLGRGRSGRFAARRLALSG